MKKVVKFKVINQYAAGIDVGSREHYVAVSPGLAKKNVRKFGSFTSDLYSLADWLKELGITTVAMESTGIYWIPLFEILEQKGLEVKLVNAYHVKNIPGRKTDMLDCQWIQELHSCGFLNGSFRPEKLICELRAYYRQRIKLITMAGTHVQHMQKSLHQMNILIHNAVSDITGKTGMQIIRAIINGETDVKRMAKLRDKKCKNSEEVIAESLRGNYKAEHIFTLKQSLNLYDFYQERIKECDDEIKKLLDQFETKGDLKTLKPKKKRKSKNAVSFNVTKELYRILGVDVTKIDGIEGNTALRIISEIGIDMSKWKTAGHFASWLGLCPNKKITGGKVLSSKTKKSANKAAYAFRLAANSLHFSNSALGAFLRRKKAQLGSPKAITATAHKIARIFYTIIKTGKEFVDVGSDYYEKKYQKRIIKNLKNKAKNMGFELVPSQKLILSTL